MDCLKMHWALEHSSCYKFSWGGLWWQQHRNSGNAETAGGEPDTKVRRKENLQRGNEQKTWGKGGRREVAETDRQARCKEMKERRRNGKERGGMKHLSGRMFWGSYYWYWNYPWGEWEEGGWMQNLFGALQQKYIDFLKVTIPVAIHLLHQHCKHRSNFSIRSKPLSQESTKCSEAIPNEQI